MSATNPYQAPRSNVDFQQAGEEYGEIKVWTTSGRMGRLRYLGYSMGYSLLIYIAFALVGGVLMATGMAPDAMVGVIMLAYVPIIVLQIMLASQRAHDFNTTGWLALLVFVPLANLVFLFIPGTDGENRFGKQPPPNRGVGIWIAILLVGIFLIGVLAAIAIPAYQSYVKKAQAAALSAAPAPTAQQ
jgi:uncharacterized membrane protein YhaH (DUF805 family)